MMVGDTNISPNLMDVTSKYDHNPQEDLSNKVIVVSSPHYPLVYILNLNIGFDICLVNV